VENKRRKGIGLEHKPRIAVVDDDQSVREGLENLVSSIGCEVKLFASAEDFLESDAPLQTDCAILDLWLPGISGLELQRKLAAEGQSIPTIIITANGNQKTQTEAHAAGVIAFLKKPFTEEVLLAAIESALKRKLR
jgi:FixJ family two-component response regulator